MPDCHASGMDPAASTINASAQKSFFNMVSIGWAWRE